MKLSAELWREVEPLLGRALDLGPDERQEWLEGIDGTHPQAAPMLRRMLATHDRAERAHELETATLVASAALRHHMHTPGQAIGPFLLISPLGRGGMGEVWLARHADGHLERKVGLKLPAAHQQGEVARERFRRERDILARLEHPHIARLYDAGVTPQGQPWLAMEVVEGVPIAQAARNLPIAGRLALFRQVLSAVALAHRHLVVHRDLKPANILVDATGQVKLLDFGIAKLIEAEVAGDDLTRAGERVMTLRYAAPEQVASGEITTATDIYSLGVVLHELLAGVSPYKAVREGRPFTELDLLQEEPRAPSRLGLPRPVARALEGDLDSIVQKAMRPEALERYASVEQLDADIAAHLERRPVAARRGTWRYRAGRFALRHKLPIAASAAIVLVLAAGLWMAERERQVALAEKARAERHLGSVRKLANTFIFDVHSKIERLPGSLEARNILVRTSLEYLDALAAEPGADPGLLYEIAVGYRNVGNILGQPGTVNKGDLRAGLANFEKAQRMFARLEGLRPADLRAIRQHRELTYAMARARFLLEDARWTQDMAENIRLCRRAEALSRGDPEDRAYTQRAFAEQAHLLSLRLGQDAQSRAQVAQAVAALEEIAAAHPGNRVVREMLIGAYVRGSGVMGSTHHTPDTMRQAIAFERKGIALVRLARREADDMRLRQTEAELVFHLGMALALAGELREGDATLATARERAQELRTLDPNPEATSLQAQVLMKSAYVALQLKDFHRTLRLAREALEALASLPPEARATRDNRRSAAESKFFAAAGQFGIASNSKLSRDRRLAMLMEAKATLREVGAYIDETAAQGFEVVPEDDQAMVRVVSRQVDEALAKLR